MKVPSTIFFHGYKKHKLNLAELLKTAIIGAVGIPKCILQTAKVERENLKIHFIQIDSTSGYRQ